MTARLATVWDALRSTLWFTPTAMTVGAFLLSLATVAIDERLDNDQIEGIAWIYAGGPEGARAVLSVVAGSMITVAGTIFSITVAALTLASSQFGPRLLRNFMRDRGNQVVLGVFIATFVYCLLVLRIVRSGDDSRVVPHVSVTTGVALGVVSLAALIYFIHHVATSIQAAHVIASVNSELERTIERLFPRQLGAGPTTSQPCPTEEWLGHFAANAVCVTASGSGYLQATDADGLMRLATRRDLVIRLEVRPGDFVLEGAPLVTVTPADSLDDRLRERIRGSFTLGLQRTQVQDVEYGVNQLVEIAVRALSPGVNDPFTAIMCIDRLAEALVRLARQPEPSPYRYDQSGKLRVMAHPFSFPGVVDAAFDQVRQYGRSSAAVTIRLLEALTLVARETSGEERRAALRRQAQMIVRGLEEGLPEQEDRRDATGRYENLLRALSQEHPVR